MQRNIGSKKYQLSNISQALITIFIALLMAFCATGCARPQTHPVYIKNGKEYGKIKGAFFKYQWWHFYERGVSYADGEFYDAAVNDIKEAIRQRNKDQRRARTYGMHFIDYFPHRELGIIYFEKGDYQSAQNELMCSLSQYPSAKAYFYLDQVRKIFIQDEMTSAPLPTLNIDFKSHEIWTNKDPVVVSGYAEDENYIGRIKINNMPVFMEGSRKRMVFHEKFDLAQGTHFIEIEAIGLTGKSRNKQLIIHVDRRGPIISIDDLPHYSDKTGKSGIIRGFVHDEAGVKSLTINGQIIPIKKERHIPFHYTVLKGWDTIEIRAEDNTGNETTASIPLIFETADFLPVLLASRDSAFSKALYAGTLNRTASHPPKIKLNGWTKEQTVFLETIYLDGQVYAGSRITHLSINSEPIRGDMGKGVFFNHFIPLVKGDNIITIKAKDEEGNISVKTIEVKRNIPKNLLLEERLSLTIMPFDKKGEISKAGLSFQENLTHTFFNQNRFKIIERDMIDMVLKEQKLSQTELIDRTTALKLGQLVAAKSIITGSIVESRKGIEIVSRMIDIETSEILATEDIYSENKGISAVKSLAEGLALKYHRDFPLTDGVILQKKDNLIVTDLNDEKAGKQRHLILYREIPMLHPVTGKKIGIDTDIIGRARIVQLDSSVSKARITDEVGQNINLMDKVITE